MFWYLDPIVDDRSHNAKAPVTHSCTSALDLAALLLDVKSGDEVIVPFCTFVSTANAFVLRGRSSSTSGKARFNLDERLIETAITTLTRTIVPVHFAGVARAMDTMLATGEQLELYRAAAIEAAEKYTGMLRLLSKWASMRSRPG